MGEVILALLLIVAAFALGLRMGRKKAPSDQVLGEAWQKGYDSATAYWQQRVERQSQPRTGPPAEHGPVLYADRPRTDAPPASRRPQATEPAEPAATVGATDTRSAAEPVATPPANTGSGLPFMRPQLAERGALQGQTPQLPAPQLPQAKAELDPRARALRNINITLYVAALLLVAAGALFLSFALPPVAKLVGLCLVAGAFYAGGLIVHRVKTTLQPAAAAFAGTGLALLPLCAIATYNTVAVSATATWLIFSVIGTLAFGYATIKLRSRILAWLAVLILISTAMSSGAMIQQGVFSYLVSLLACAVLLQLVMLRSRTLHESLFYQAIATSINLLPPLVFLISLVMLFDLSSRELFWTFLLLSAHYLLTTRLNQERRGLHFAVARLFALLSVVAALDYLDAELEMLFLALVLLLVGQGILLTRFAEPYRHAFGISGLWFRIERLILWALALGSILLLYLAASGAPDGTWWVTLLLIPAAMGLVIWVSRQGGRLEPGVLLALAALTAFEQVQSWWRPLPALTIAVIGFSLVAKRKPVSLARAAAHLRWLLLLLVGAKLTQTGHLLTGGSRFEQLMPALVGIWLVCALLFLRNLRVLRHAWRSAKQRTHYLARALASIGLLLLIISQTRIMGERRSSGIENLFSLEYQTWSVILLLATVPVLLTFGWVQQKFASTRPDPVLHGATLLALALTFGLSLRADFWWLAPLVALAHLLFLSSVLLRPTDSPWKIAYAALAQLHFTAATWWMLWYFEVDYHGQLAVLLLSVLLPQGMRLALRIRRANGLTRELEIITLGLLVMVPLILGGYALDLARPDRGTLILGLVAWIGYALLAHQGLKTKTYRQWLLLPEILGKVALALVGAATMNPFTGWIRSTLWNQGTVQWILVALVVIAALNEYRQRANTSHSQLRLVALAVPWFTLLASQHTTGWLATALILGALCLGLLVHTRHTAWFALPAAVSGIAASYTGWLTLAARPSMGQAHALDLSWAMFAAALLLLITALLHGRFTDPVPAYPVTVRSEPGAVGAASRIYYAAMLSAGAVAGLNAHLLVNAQQRSEGSLAVLGGGVLILLIATLVRLHELPQRWGHHGTDGIILLSVALAARSYQVLLGPLDLVAIVLVFATVCAGIGLRHLRIRAQLSTGWLIAAAGLATFSEVLSLTGTSTLVQMLILLFFVALLVFGLIREEKIFIWWAAIAITAAVIWFLRNYAFLLLALLAAGLIALAIFKLMKVEKTPK